MILRMSDKGDSFKRLATQRVNRTLNDLRLIGNLSNRANYEFSAEEVDAIFAALKSGVKECKARFDLAMDPADKGFRLG